NVELTEVVAVNQPLFRVADASKFVAEVTVDEADVARVRAASSASAGAGSRVALRAHALPGRTLPGRVLDVFPDADRERKTYAVRIEFDDAPPELRSGMSIEASILSDEHDGVVVPVAAERNGSVWLVTDGRAHER